MSRLSLRFVLRSLVASAVVAALAFGYSALRYPDALQGLGLYFNGLMAGFAGASALVGLQTALPTALAINHGHPLGRHGKGRFFMSLTTLLVTGLILAVSLFSLDQSFHPALTLLVAGAAMLLSRWAAPAQSEID